MKSPTRICQSSRGDEVEPYSPRGRHSDEVGIILLCRPAHKKENDLRSPFYRYFQIQ